MRVKLFNPIGTCLKYEYARANYARRLIDYFDIKLLTLHKFKVWMTIVESGWNVWVGLVGVVSRRRVWLVGVGRIYCCG